jgi:ribosomal protein L11 methyltransferase
LIGHDGILKTTADLLVANILAKVLIDLIKKGLGEVVQPNGLLILSGILDHQTEEVIQIAHQNNLKLLETSESEDWRALILKRNSPH